MAFLLPIIGYAIGGPWGALIGGFLQDIFFPAEGPKGPRLNELNVQHSTVGAPIPIVYGTAKLAGNVIWSGGLLETKHEDEQGGFLGVGGTKVTTYTYSVDVAIGICEGPIDGIRRIWADADLIYDSSSDEDLSARFAGGSPTHFDDWDDFVAHIRAGSAQQRLNFELYLGTEDQLADPTIEAYEGVGLVPGFRGLAYIVFNDFQLEKFGNRIPNFRFEVYSGTPTECGLYSAGNLQPWWFQTHSGVFDPRNPANTHIYGYTELGNEVDTTFTAALAEMNAASSHGSYAPFLIGAVPQEGDSIYIHGWSTSSTPNYIQPCDPDDMPEADYVVVYMTLNATYIIEADCHQDVGGNTCANWWSFLGGKGHPRYVSSGQNSGVVVATNHDQDPAPWFGDIPYTDSDVSRPFNNCSGPEGAFDVWRLQSHELGVKRDILPPDPCAYGTPLVGAPGYCVVNGQIVQGITWSQVSGSFKVLQRYTISGPFGVVENYPVSPALRSDDPNYNDQDYWEAAYADALAAGEPIASGLTYGVDYPQTQSFAYFSECDTVDTACVPMAVIVADICQRAGLRIDTSTQIDVSGLTTCVNGYIIGRQMSARDALGPLRMFGLWDATESQGLLRFVERGAAIVESLTADDLGAHENGSQAPTAVEVTRVQEKDLPRRLRLHFANFLHDHEVSEQSASRISTEAIDELDVDLPISMEPDTAKQLAEIMLYETWFGRSTFRFSLDNSRLALEPTDCVEIPVDGETRRVRIVAVDYSIGGIIKIDAVADDDGAYVSTAVAVPSEPSGGVPGGAGEGPICPSGLVLLDIPRLNAAHIDAGYYAAIYGQCGSWACAELYRSNDGGVTYGRIGRTNAETTVGEIVTITGPATDPTLPGDSPAYDDANSITVTLFEGTLGSITDAQIDAGQNMAAIGIDGRWVIIQFKTATLDTGETWVLTDLIWGLNDTQHLLGTSIDGDTFVLLSDPDLLRIPESPDAIGVEKQFKVVTCGEAVDAVSPVDFVTWGLSYQRPCTSTVISVSTTTPPEDATDGDAYLLPNDTSLAGVWAGHGGEIATWSDETDSWVYCTPVPGTVIHVIEGTDTSDSSGGGGDDVIIDEDGNPQPAPWAPTSASYVTVDDERATLPNSLPLIAGDNITLEQDSSGLIIHGAAGGDTGDTSGGGPIALDDLTDVTIGSPFAEGDVLVYRGTEGWVNEPVETVFGGGGGMSFVDETSVVGSATQTMTVSGLDLDADESYFVQFELQCASASSPLGYMLFNGDTTLANYDSIVHGLTSGGDGPIRADLPTFNSNLGGSGDQTVGFAWVRRGVDGKPRATGEISRRDAGNLGLMTFSVVWTTSANVTSFAIHASVASALAVGSKMQLWRLTTSGTGGGGGGSYSPPVTTKGDLFTFDTDDARLAVGTTGDVLVADSSTATGLKWGVPGIPSNPQTSNYTIVANDNGRSIDHASGAGAGDTYTIPANGTLALPLGFTFSVSNMDSNALTVAITTDTLRKAGTGSTGSVSVAQYGTATFRKVATTEWLWTGVGAT